MGALSSRPAPSAARSIMRAKPAAVKSEPRSLIKTDLPPNLALEGEAPQPGSVLSQQSRIQFFGNGAFYPSKGRQVVLKFLDPLFGGQYADFTARPFIFPKLVVFTGGGQSSRRLARALNPHPKACKLVLRAQDSR